MNTQLIIPPPFAPLLDDKKRTIVQASGRSSGKTTTTETAVILNMLKNGNQDIWYCRAERNDIRGSIFTSLWKNICKLGVEKYFYPPKTSPFEIKCRSGSVCQFLGINGKTKDDTTATKGFEPLHELAYVIVDEANEVKSPLHIDALRSTAEKFFTKNTKVVFSYNPPPVLNHWANVYFKQQAGRSDGLNIYTTFHDVWGLLSEETRQGIFEMAKTDPRQFEYWYLGKQISLQGLVLFTFKEENNLVTPQQLIERRGVICQPLFLIMGVDSGLTHDPTAVTIWGVFADGNMVKLYTIYIDPRKRGRECIIPNSEQAVLIQEHYYKFRERMKQLGIRLPSKDREVWCFDGAGMTQDLMIELQRLMGIDCKAITNKSIERDTKRLQNGYHIKLLQILDIKENEESLREIKGYIYDEVNNIPDGQDDHTIDADKYATYYYYNEYMMNIRTSWRV